MPGFNPPRLDDRTFEDLRRELVRRIPVHSPEWTDHHPSDPGITLLELFAWLTENLLHRVNQVPQNAQLEFLKLLGVLPRPASSARAFLRFALPKGATGPQLIESGPLQGRTVVSAGKVLFQVDDELEILPVEGLAVVKAPGTLDVEDEDLVGYRALLTEHLGDEDDVPELATYETMVLPEPEGDALPPAQAIDAAADGALWVAVLAPEPVFKSPSFDRDTAIQGLAGRVLSVGVRVDDVLCGATDHQACPDPGSATTGRTVLWQIATGRFSGNERRVTDLRYERLRLVDDTTAGLTRSGVIRLQLPLSADDIGRWTAEDFGLSGMAGIGDLPPAFDDPALAGRVLTWLRCFRPQPLVVGADPIPQPTIRWLGVNVVWAEQAVTAQEELLGTGAGTPGQLVRLVHAPVLDSTLILEVREPGPIGWVQWHRVADLSVSLPNDPHYVLDPTTGGITFGDGVHGRMPRLGEYIRARTYRYGGGAAGNVSGGAIGRVVRSTAIGVKVDNPLPAWGGKDGETVEEAKTRIPQALRHRERAVAATDFRDLALETPGVQVGRIEVLPRHKPFERVDEVPGVVTLVALPAHDPVHPDEPTPDREMLRCICEHLEPRRLVTTELYVTPPEYVPVWISVAVEVKEGYGLQTVRTWVDLAIRQHMAPLPPYGPGGSGWPMGRKVRDRDVEAAVLQVEGVRLANEVIVEGTEIDAAGETTSKKEEITLRRWQLPVLRNVQVVAGEKAETINRSGDSVRPPAATAPDDGTPLPLLVPVVEEEC